MVNIGYELADGKLKMRRTNKKLVKEPIAYFKSENGDLSGYLKNLRFINGSGRSIDELNLNIKIMCRFWLDYLNELMEMDRPFVCIEDTDFDRWVYGERLINLKKELKQYKDIFGELPSND